MENRNWIYLSIAILLEFGEFSSGQPQGGARGGIGISLEARAAGDLRTLDKIRQKSQVGTANIRYVLANRVVGIGR